MTPEDIEKLIAEARCRPRMGVGGPPDLVDKLADVCEQLLHGKLAYWTNVYKVLHESLAAVRDRCDAARAEVEALRAVTGYATAGRRSTSTP